MKPYATVGVGSALVAGCLVAAIPLLDGGGSAALQDDRVLIILHESGRVSTMPMGQVQEVLGWGNTTGGSELRYLDEDGNRGVAHFSDRIVSVETGTREDAHALQAEKRAAVPGGSGTG